MKIIIPKNKISNPETGIRRCGYGQVVDRRTRQVSYARRLTGGLYPRFHVYIEEAGDNWSFNLHLDQRSPIYFGVTAHSGEYDGEAVSAEGERIRGLLTKL